MHELTARGHEVLIQSGAGVGSGISRRRVHRRRARASCPTADEVWAEADLLLKVKEPIAAEYPRLRKGQALFTYLHLAASRACTDALLAAGTTAIAYETVQLPNRTLPLLQPMSEVAGRLSHPGRRVPPDAARTAARACCSAASPEPPRPRSSSSAAVSPASTRPPTRSARRRRDHHRHLDPAPARARGALRRRPPDPRLVDRTRSPSRSRDADLVIGSVLIPGEKAPKLVTDAMVATMKPGSVLVDIAIDQGGCFEGSRPTTHDDPTFAVHDTIYYCVANMPGAVPGTSTRALTNATLPYVLALADKGWRTAITDDPALALGLNAHDGQVTNEGVAGAFGMTASRSH